MRRLKLFLLGLVVISLSACGGGSSDNNSSQIGLAGISECAALSEDQAVVCGTVLASDGITPLVNAEVTLATISSRSLTARGVNDTEKCLTNGTGDFVCVLPVDVSGEVTLNVSLNGFTTTTIQTTATTGQSTESGSQVLVADISSRWIVVPGVYDGVQVLLAQLKGCTLTGPGGVDYTSDIDPSEARGSADCESKGLVVLDQEFTFDGNTLVENSEDITSYFASNELLSNDALFINCEADNSTPAIDSLIQSFTAQGGNVYFSDLSSSWLTKIFPDNITFEGGDTYIGSISADIIDPGLAAVFDNEPVSLSFDSRSWSAIESVATNVKTFIQADISSISEYTGTRPITVGWKENSGCVFYTSYHIDGDNIDTPDQGLVIKYLLQNITSVC